MFWVELIVVLAMIVIGARYGGLGLGMMGGLGVAILSFLLGDLPSDPPVEVMLMIAAVVTAAGTLQAAGGMDYLVDLAEKALRKPPAGHHLRGPAGGLRLHPLRRHRPRRLRHPPGHRRGLPGGGRAPGAPPLHLGHRLAAGHHREPHLGGHGGAAPPGLRGRHHARGADGRVHPGHARRGPGRRAGGEPPGQGARPGPRVPAPARRRGGRGAHPDGPPPRDLAGQGLGGPLRRRRRRHRPLRIHPRPAPHLRRRRDARCRWRWPTPSRW